MSSFLQALLSAHDTVAQKDFEPVLPPLPDNIPENEEAMRIVCLVKNKQPLVRSFRLHYLHLCNRLNSISCAVGLFFSNATEFAVILFVLFLTGKHILEMEHVY